MIAIIVEVILGIGILILAAALPAAVGFCLVKLYRKIVPLQKGDLMDVDQIINAEGDSFGKMLLVGWLVCGPFYLWLFLSHYF